MIKVLICSLEGFVGHVKQYRKQSNKPVIDSIAMGSLSDLRRSYRDLILKNAILRQQLIVLNRQAVRLQLPQDNWLQLVLLTRMTEFWQQGILSNWTRC